MSLFVFNTLIKQNLSKMTICLIDNQQLHVESDFLYVYKCLDPIMGIEIANKSIKNNRLRSLGAYSQIINTVGFDCFQDENIYITKNEYGKPYIHGSEDIFFSISHSFNWSTCVLSEKSVGVDIENNSVNEGLLDFTLFHDSEFRLVQQVPNKERVYIYYKLWTMKEAYLKAIGTGLRRSLSSFYSVVTGRNSARIYDCYSQKYAECYTYSNLVKDHTLSICFINDEKKNEAK